MNAVDVKPYSTINIVTYKFNYINVTLVVSTITEL